MTEECISVIGTDEETRENCAIMLITSDESGYPNVALLSPYQVVAPSDKSVFVSIYSGSNSCKFLENEKKGTLVIQTIPGLTYLKCGFEFIGETFQITGSERKVFVSDHFQSLIDVSDIAPFLQELRFEQSALKSTYKEEFKKLSRIAVDYGKGSD